MHWGGIVFAAVVIGLAIPFAASYSRGPNSPLRMGASRPLVGAVVVAALLLIFVTIVGALDGFPNRAAYWTLNIALSVLFWVMLLRLCWRERRQRPR